MADICKYSYIIVGGGIAGVTCAEHLSVLDPSTNVLLISATALVKRATNVLAITKTLTTFDVDEQFSDLLEAQCSNVKVVHDVVVQLDAVNKTVCTSHGVQFEFEQLCICSGAKPHVIDNKNPLVLSIRDTDSVLHFQDKLKDARRIIIVGNGGIATEMVYELTGIEIIWAVKDRFINAAFLEPGAAEFLKSELTKDKCGNFKPTKRLKYTVKSVRGEKLLGSALGPDWHSVIELSRSGKRHVFVEENVEVRRLWSPAEYLSEKLIPSKISEEEGGDWPIYVELTNGKVYGCDFVVSATGVVPNTAAFLSGNDFAIASDNGFLVNDHLETSHRHVYAAGDVCSPNWDIALHWFQVRLWTQARQMGAYAAKCMWASLYNEEIYMDFCFELFSHVTKFLGQKVILLGVYNGQKLDGRYEVLLRVTPGLEYVKCVMVDGKMQGAILIGETDLEETFENLILNQMDLTQFGEDILNPDIDIEDYFD